MIICIVDYFGDIFSIDHYIVWSINAEKCWSVDRWVKKLRNNHISHAEIKEYWPFFLFYNQSIDYQNSWWLI